MLRKSLLICLAFAATAIHAQPQSQIKQLEYVNAACSISPKEFNSWFAGGTISKNGIVDFADSVNFPTNNTKCDFYKWAHQMFLWITSPIDGGILLDSATFFDMHKDIDAAGNTFYRYEKNSANTVNKGFALRDTKSQHIQPGGQAGGDDTLLSLNGSLVYFAIHANDVYAWFNTALTNKQLPAGSPFPTTQAELNAVLNYATSKGAKINDGNALTMELKTAWIDAATVANVADYITIDAMVPNYVKTSDTQWTISSSMPTIQKTLALVGVHVVGPVQGHPEMVWATFEHRNNAPDNDFYFNDLTGKTQSVPYNSTGQWNFMASGGSQSGALVAQMTVDSTNGNINATQGNKIQPNNVYRVNPWGNAPTQASAENNSELISLNLDILFMLGLAGDVRSNYFQVGAVWTKDGSIPSTPTDPQLIGSLLLANSTMETYHQQGSAQSDQGCFGCHAASTSTGTSHVFNLKNIPLVPPSIAARGL